MQKIITLLKTLICVVFSLSATAQTWNYVGSSSGVSSIGTSFNNIASDGTNPIIAYATGDIINGSNIVQKYNGSSWGNYGSSSGFGSGHTYELKLAMDGTTPYAAWQDDWYNYKIVAAKFNGTNWQTLGTAGFSQGQVYSIDITISGGTPYVVYKDGPFGQITVQKFDGIGWVNVGSARFTPAIGSSIISPKIVVNGSTPYVFFGDNATYGGKARLVKFDGTNWVNIGTPGFSTGTIAATKLYFVGSTPYVVFTEQSANTYIKTMKYDGTNWITVNNEQFTTNSSSSLMGLEVKDTTPYALYTDPNNSTKLTLKKFNGTNWIVVGDEGFSYANVSQAALTFVGSTPYVSFNGSASSYKTVVMRLDCTATYGSSSISICPSALPYTWKGKTINAAGTYYDTIAAGNSVGCDSITTLTLTIKSTSTYTINTSICSSALPYSWNGLTFNEAGSQTAHLTNSVGCDSAATLNLSIKTNYTITASAASNGSISNSGATSVCSGNNQSYTITANSGYYISDVLVDGISVGNSANYTFNNVTGNHTISASFTITCQPTTSTSNITICSSQLPYVWNGLTFNSAGSQTKHLTNNCSNDSAATLNLTVNATSTSTTNITVCTNALPYSWNGLTFLGAASQTAHFTNTVGCDSAATLNLNITPQPTPANNSVCVGSTIQLSNATSGGVWSLESNRATVSVTGLVTGKKPGTVVVKYKLPNGTTTNYTITVNALPNVPSIIYATGTANPQLGAPSGAFCINKTFGVVGVAAGGVFSVGNSSVLTINCSGIINTVGLGSSYLNYRYTNAAGCSNSRTMTGTVVNCVSHRNSMTADEQIIANDFVLYPNPAKSSVSLNINDLFAEGQIIVTNIYGKQVKIQTISIGTNMIDIVNLAKGMYFVTTITNEGKTTKKLVVE